MVAATAFFTCGDAAMKLVSDSLPTGETVFLRGVSTVTHRHHRGLLDRGDLRAEAGIRATHGLAQHR